MDQTISISGDVADTAAAPVARRVPVSLQTRMVILSYLAYFFYYFTRKHLGVATASLVDAGYSKQLIGDANFGFSLLYMVGQGVSGYLGDRIGPRITICAGMVLSALATLAFGFFPLMGLLVVTCTLNGFFQATGWSNTCKVVSSWVTPAQRGRVMGFWLTCYILGSLAATALAGLVVQYWGWKHLFQAAGLIVLVVGIVQGLFLISRPKDAGYEIEEEAASHGASLEKPKGFSEVIRHPSVLLLGVSYTGIKFIRYTFFAWLPLYLREVAKAGNDTAAYTSLAFEIGGVIGLLPSGYLAARWFPDNRTRLAFVALLVMTLVVVLYRQMGGAAGSNLYAHGIGLAGIGAFLYIADSIVSGTAAQDLGGAAKTASVAGVINGIGSIGALCSSKVPIWLEERWGWDSIFVAFIVLSVVSCIAIAPVAMKRELKPI
ncbi:MFS transporter [Luteolibacter sp. LG18]|uniref:MFS transporter n=1 Tax=Luteolibacter sp. LG18 TaxID=2819286 RepID=UPI002B287ADC|nr:MFS transporter [Luteolibacter sp. LG18]